MQGETVRLAVFFGLLLLLIGWETLAPRRRAASVGRLRQANNLALGGLNALLQRLSFPVLGVGMAQWTATGNWGLLQFWPLGSEFLGEGFAEVLGGLIALVILDLAVYTQHVLMHRLPWLWRLHCMHHSDVALDASSGVRFHPGEILLSMVWKLFVVALLGAPAWSVILFEVLLNATALFSHADIRLPRVADALVRCVFVTPDMHRVHHSLRAVETERNFGFCLSWWDRLFRTYRAQPQDGHLGMQIGLPQFREPQELRLRHMLSQPLRLHKS